MLVEAKYSKGHDKEGKGKGVYLVKFASRYRGYNPGEIAGFTYDKAVELVLSKIAYPCDAEGTALGGEESKEAKAEGKKAAAAAKKAEAAEKKAETKKRKDAEKALKAAAKNK